MRGNRVIPSSYSHRGYTFTPSPHQSRAFSSLTIHCFLPWWYSLEQPDQVSWWLCHTTHKCPIDTVFPSVTEMPQKAVLQLSPHYPPFELTWDCLQGYLPPALCCLLLLFPTEDSSLFPLSFPLEEESWHCILVQFLQLLVCLTHIVNIHWMGLGEAVCSQQSIWRPLSFFILLLLSQHQNVWIYIVF